MREAAQKQGQARRSVREREELTIFAAVLGR